MDIVKHNQIAWDNQSRQQQSPWVQPVSPEEVAAARSGIWQVVLTPKKTVPAEWFGNLKHQQVLGLASAGGQQVPIFAAAGAQVTSFDNSLEQLDKDKLVAEREGLNIALEQGDMADLSRFQDETFDLIFHPVSNVFSEHILPVWRHCARILRPGGRLLSGFMNPDFFMFDHEDIDAGGPLEVSFSLPFADIEQLSHKQIMALQQRGEALEFSHSLQSQIGGQLEAGLMIAGFYEDRWDTQATLLNDYMPTSMATLAIKPESPVAAMKRNHKDKHKKDNQWT
ncbi:MAG: class I SAM-dependent methyltransferase [Pseudomonadales bacterium]|nr:class I SAM-dependent methyltransferase [Pseudomonadales bacterium]